MTITENEAAKSDGSAEVVPFGELRITDKNKGEKLRKKVDVL
jgi:hypothetical protein